MKTIEQELAECREKLDRTPIDWDTELDALQISNDALRAEVERGNKRIDADWQEIKALTARVAELEGTLEKIATGELDGDDSYLLARSALSGTAAKPAPD